MIFECVSDFVVAWASLDLLNKNLLTAIADRTNYKKFFGLDLASACVERRNNTNKCRLALEIRKRNRLQATFEEMNLKIRGLATDGQLRAK